MASGQTSGIASRNLGGAEVLNLFTAVALAVLTGASAGAIITVPGDHSGDDRHPLVDFRSPGAQIFVAVGCRSSAEGTLHADACPIIAVDNGNIGSLSSMR